MKKNKLNIVCLIVLIFFTVILILILKEYYVNNRIKEKGKSVLTRLDSIVRYPKRTSFYFSYYWEGNKISTTHCGIKKSMFNSSQENKSIDAIEIGAFYWADLLPEYPDYIQVNPNNKITDTITISKSGFMENIFKRHP